MASKHVAALMAWHPSSDAGVRIPFKAGIRPLRKRIETPLIARLNQHARDLLAGSKVPRLILLVGGSGNGKTDAVEAYVEELDRESRSDDSLLHLVRDRFLGEGPLPAWLVKVDASHADGDKESLARVGLLRVLQDASASTAPDGDAAVQLLEVISEATQSPGSNLLLACVNRGLLNRVLKKAFQDPSKKQVVDLIKQVALACSEIVEAGTPPSCWPLDLPDDDPLEGQVAVWPLDLESLLIETPFGSPVFDQVFDEATQPEKWASEECDSCPASKLCPFRHNALSLGAGGGRDGLRTILRDFEISTGARWTFRQLFGLAAELIVGHPAAFEGSDPCTWAREHVGTVRDIEKPASDPSLLALHARLYPSVLFPFSIAERSVASSIASDARKLPIEILKEDLVRLLELIAAATPSASTHLQQRLATVLAPRFDPSIRASAGLESEPFPDLEAIFEACDVNVKTALLVASNCTELSEIERLLVARFAECEQLVNPMQRSSVIPRDVLGFLRAITASVLSRSIGARRGLHGLRTAMADYLVSARSKSGLKKLAKEEVPLLFAPPDGRLRFELLETLEQRSISADRAFTLVSRPLLSVSPVPAQPESSTRPATHLPAIKVESRNVPLTFDFFAALRERESRRVTSSESVAIRAAIGQARILIAGARVRDASLFEEYDLRYDVGEDHVIRADEQGRPTLEKRDE